MPSLTDDRLLLSVPASRLDITSAFDYRVELKFDWEDYEILSGERGLPDALDDAAVDPTRVISVHLPPGVRTRGRAIGMAATDANLGTIVDFVHDQLSELPHAFLVMHPPRKFDYGDQLTLLSKLCDLTGHEISIENPPDDSFWYTPEDIAFFGFVGATYPDWENLYVTIDSAHLPTARSPDDPIDRDAISDLVCRLEGLQGLDVASLEKAYTGHLAGNVAEFRPEGIDRLENDAWTPLLNALLLTADRTKSVHFNDPVEDGIPDLAGHRGQSTLEVIREIARNEDIYLVLEPDREMFDRPDELSRRVDAVDSWLNRRDR